MIMHKKIGLEKALLTFPSYVLLTNELHTVLHGTTILGGMLFRILPHFGLYRKTFFPSMVFFESLVFFSLLAYTRATNMFGRGLS